MWRENIRSDQNQLKLVGWGAWNYTPRWLDITHFNGTKTDGVKDLDDDYGFSLQDYALERLFV